MLSHTPLEWDTEHLGIPTAKITSITPEILAEAKQAGIKLIYLVLPQEKKIAIALAQSLGGILVDHKVTYLIDLKKISLTPDPSVKSYTEKKPSDDLINLAYESGNFSRFPYGTAI
jgi:hypothetical protein